jgi:hypothetical protein
MNSELKNGKSLKSGLLIPKICPLLFGVAKHKRMINRIVRFMYQQ